MKKGFLLRFLGFLISVTLLSGCTGGGGGLNSMILSYLDENPEFLNENPELTALLPPGFIEDLNDPDFNAEDYITPEILEILEEEGLVEPILLTQSETPQNPAPEPATMILLGSGLLGLALAGRARRKI